MLIRSIMFKLSLTLLISRIAAQSYDYGVDIESLTRRDPTARILVGRLPLYPDGSVPQRLEIREMEKDAHRWDLFILSLSMFQYVSQSDPMSWYQVAGIHGVPFRTWNGVGPVDGGDQAGYCTHNSVLFPTWHRPYLALIEQEMFRMANFIAGMFPNNTERALYQRAAADIRFPYWDWTLPAPPGESHLPDVFWKPTIMQYGPRGVQNIRNPLYAYPFHPLEEDALIWHPQRLLILFSSYKDFNAFSNKAWATSRNLSSWDSIESIHDIVHIYGGLKGHMTYVPLSSFDPLFFLHHMTTDRLFAMWQILNPDAWIRPMPAGESSYTSTLGTVETSETELKPFYINNNTFWTSDMARTTEIFGYTYADTDIYGTTEDELRMYLTRKINDWWGGSSVMGLDTESSSSHRLYPHIVSDVSAAYALKGFKPNMKDSLDVLSGTIIDKGRYTEWIANVHVNVEAMDASYAVHFFFGEAPPGCEWATAVNEVGSVAIFAMNHGTGSKAKISGTLPLTTSLLKMVAAGTIPHLRPDAVEPFIHQALEFRVCDINDDEVDPKSVEGLFIGVSSAEVTLPYSKNELPRWNVAVPRVELWS
ncbi:hypothetical protein N3K66_007731 [Trichothecium roseum]|uniref:Uncharacterized protein n=1 Tax=Trichothecium roseum TaxID=47278 RepID=A0ACC0UUS7_9HYPO|nr:hypothetical protein N3K66_007731 [Trichothecium roseum]